MENDTITENKDLYGYYYMLERKRVRIPLILSLIGLLTSFLYGLGGIFSLVALILAAARYRVKKSTTLKWAIWISVITLSLCVLFVGALIAAYIAARSAVPVEPVAVPTECIKF